MSDIRLVRIEDKLDTVNSKIANIDSTLAAQHESLKHHIKRTDLLEKKIEPIQKHVAMVHGAMKLIGLMATIAGIVEVILMIMRLK